MKGAITEFRIPKSGKYLWVTTAPDLDIEGSVNQHLLSKLGMNGQLIWEMKENFPIKDISVADDSSFAVLSNYENQLMALNANGKTLWTVEEMCKPIIWNRAKKIICYHDDDNQPQVGFDVYDWKGKKTFSYKVAHPVISLTAASDESALALGLVGGSVIYFSSELTPLWEKSVPGEIVDSTISIGSGHEIGVLYRDRVNSKMEKIMVFDRMGKPVSDSLNSVSLPFNANQIGISPNGKELYYYANSLKKQVLGAISLSSSKEVWNKQVEWGAEYNSFLTPVGAQVFVGFQDNQASQDRTHILSFDEQGQLRKNILVPTEKTAFLYSYQVAPQVSRLVVASDDGKLSVYSSN